MSIRNDFFLFVNIMNKRGRKVGIIVNSKLLHSTELITFYCVAPLDTEVRFYMDYANKAKYRKLLYYK